MTFTSMEIVFIIAGVLALAVLYSLTVASAKPIPGSGMYKISRDGRVLMCAGPKVSAVRPTLYPDGLRVKLRGGNRVGEFYVHELVAEVYLPNPKRHTLVRHKDGNLRNNNMDNLELVAEAPETAAAPVTKQAPETLIQT